jgi:adenine-specific DNA-methyltransferase
MPTLNWIGKDKVISHHQDVPYRVLEHKYGFNAKKGEQTEPTQSGNKIIHGDNLEALKSLLPEYENKVKCIYIDPPYNTGNEGWIYNDNVNHPKIKKWLGEVVGKDGEDLTRHDKWLCMMYPRIKLLNKLLSNDGVIFISIGDDEYASLKMLCDEIFGRKNFLASFIWNTEGNTDNQLEIKINHEYILVYLKKWQNKSLAIGKVIDPNTRADSNLWKGIADNNINKNNPRNPPVTVTLPKGFPSVEESLYYEKKVLDKDFFDITNEERLVSDDVKEKYNIENNSGLPVKIDDMIVRNFKLDKECRIYGGLANHSKLKKFIENSCEPILDNDGSELTFYINRNAAVRYRKQNPNPRNILSVLRNFGTTEKMKTELKKASIKFDYPKPIELIKYLVSIGAPLKNSIVLDSFAGSGTTGNAVLEQNKEDNGKRKFILIEMENYADNVTSSRIKTAIKGSNGKNKTMDGTGGSFDFYELGLPLFDDNQNLNEQVGIDKIREYIWFSETRTTFKEIKEANYFLGKKDNSVYYFIYEKNKLTTLDFDALELIKTKGEQYIIYADNCLLPKEFMAKNNIIFKKIPRDITRF